MERFLSGRQRFPSGRQRFLSGRQRFPSGNRIKKPGFLPTGFLGSAKTEFLPPVSGNANIPPKSVTHSSIEKREKRIILPSLSFSKSKPHNAKFPPQLP
jgi:hypothetical protein